MARGYKVVFTGRLVEGHEHEAIRERLARRFKVPETKMGHFFEGQPFVVTIRPEEDEAERCRGALEQAGLLCTVIPLRDGPARKEAYQKVPPPSHEQLLPPDPEPAAVHQELIPAREIPRRSDATDPQEPTPVATVVREQRVSWRSESLTPRGRRLASCWGLRAPC
jgi:hypothetical protein